MNKMASSPDSVIEQDEFSSLKIKLSGNLGELHVVDNSDSDEHEDNHITIHAKQTPQSLEEFVKAVPALLQPSTAPAPSNTFNFSSSENIQIGDNTYFHGPVTINQIIKTKGIDNASYTPTDNESPACDSVPAKPTYEESSQKILQVRPWLKVTLSLASVGVLGIICTIAFLIQSHNKSDTIQANTESASSVKETNDPLLISPTHLRIVSRTDWLAQPVENELAKIRQPVPWVIVTHTATEGCSYQSQCVLRVRLIQMFHIESKKWDDIGYNFLVAGDGSAYFGRGWDYVGAHTLGYNRYSIGIAFVGTFNNEAPPQKQIEACQKLIKLGVQLGKIRKDYRLFAHRQLASTLSPGDKLYDIIKEWPHFVKDVNNLEELTPKDY